MDDCIYKSDAAVVCGFQNSSHTPFFEEPDEYFATLTEFLGANRAITKPSTVRGLIDQIVT